MAGPSDFVLRQVVREVLDTSLLSDPRELAVEVFTRIGATQRAEALQQALTVVVRQVISEQRHVTHIADPTRVQRPTTSSGPTRAGMVREWWQRSLRDRIHVGQSNWKPLGDCTYDDIVFAAEERREQASRNNAKARQYQFLAGLLTDHDVKRVRDLPVETLARTLGTAAA